MVRTPEGSAPKKKVVAKKAAPQAKTNPPAHDLRAAIVEFWLWGIAHEPQIHYAQERPMERLNTPKQLEKLPRNMDCSEFFTDAYAFAGAPDPNGQNYNGTGFTDTLIGHGIQVPKGEVKHGDAVIFGDGTGHHVCGILEPGDDPVLASHGQERGPMRILLSQEAPYQPNPVRFFRYLP